MTIAYVIFHPIDKNVQDYVVVFLTIYTIIILSDIVNYIKLLDTQFGPLHAEYGQKHGVVGW
ncbi:hypothetical protein P615_05460 [Brevibacillus laterosporus PE36]|nr:hypothetical protein P615_05460 [Brevibacillus laterosporus PE36]